MVQREDQPDPIASLDDETRRLAAVAIEKRRAGGSPTKRETGALRRLEAAREELLRHRYYKTIPAKHWREMSGRSDKVRNEQAERYGIPFGGSAIDLGAVVRRLHDFLAENARVLAATRGDPITDDPLLSGVDQSSPALERFRAARAELARMDVEERKKNLMQRERVREAHVRIAAVLRQCGDTIYRQFGTEAGAVFDDALSEVAQEVARVFGSGDDAAEPPPEPEPPPAEPAAKRRSRAAKKKSGARKAAKGRGAAGKQ